MLIVAFYIQVHAGHVAFEKRKPALMDGLLESILVAPLFVVYEAQWFFGFHLQLKHKVEPMIAHNVSKVSYRAPKAA